MQLYSDRMTIARVLIGMVLFFNIQAAFVFIINPTAYTAGFEVNGVPGEKLVQGMGILFLMWNVPYIFALIHPVRHRISLLSAIIMQAIGVAGESILLATLPAGHSMLTGTALRFIVFDGVGLMLLGIAWIITRHISNNRETLGKPLCN